LKEEENKGSERPTEAMKGLGGGQNVFLGTGRETLPLKKKTMETSKIGKKKEKGRPKRLCPAEGFQVGPQNGSLKKCNEGAKGKP